MSNEDIKVSVIIPIYNVEKYIQKCLESVLHQTWSNLEIICVNDGTRDSSMEIVRTFAEKDSRIVMINMENSGLSVARNTGMDCATGEYICFLDSDDYLAQDSIEILVNKAVSSDADLVFFGAESIFETENLADKQGGYATYYQRKGTYTDSYTGEKLFVELVENNDFKPSACLIFIKRAFLKNLHVKFYPGILHEDNLFTLQLIQGAEKAVVLDLPLYKRLIRESSITSGEKSVQRAYGFYVCHSELLSYLGKRDYSLEFYLSLQKYLTLMKTNALSNVADMDLPEIFSCIKAIAPEKSADFMDYISMLYGTAQNSGNGIRQRCIRLLSGIKKVIRRGFHILKRMKDRVVSGISAPVRWSVRIIRKCASAFFIYRQKQNSRDKICVSVIMPVYNAEKYLKQTLDSLVKQTLKNIEIICVDDGSADSSPEILKEYEARDERIRVFRQEKQGAGAARNYGLEQARGEYLLFLDSDDLFDKNLCGEVYYQAVRKKADVCLFGAKRLDMKTMKTEPMGWVLQRKLLPDKAVFSARDVGDRLYQITSGCPWSKMFSRQFVMDNGLRYQNLPNANDAFFVRMNLSLAERITVVDCPYVTYRYNEGHNIQSNKANAPLAFYEAFKAMKLELTKRGIFEVFERTYCNMVLSEILFNLRTVNDKDAQRSICKKMAEEGITYLGILDHTADYYGKPQDYREIQRIYEQGKEKEVYNQ